MTSLTVPKTDYRRTYIKRPSGRRRSSTKEVGVIHVKQRKWRGWLACVVIVCGTSFYATQEIPYF